MYLTVRKYRKVEGDRNQVIESVNKSFLPMISKIDGFVDYYCFFADDGALLWRDTRGHLVAFNMVHRSGVEGWMGPLAVRAEHQGSGTGKEIVALSLPSSRWTLAGITIS